MTALSLAIVMLLGTGPAAPEKDFLDRMEVEHAEDSPVASPAAATGADVDVETTERVHYADIEGTAVHGYLARPAGGSGTPGVIMIHEWWGLNDNVRAMARKLAGAGYTVLAVDLYEGEVAEDRENASRLARGSRERGDRLESNLRQAHAYLEQAGASKVGVIGWCFGGSWSLETALLLGDEIDGAVIYYGRLETDPDALAALAAPVLGLFGDQDRGIPVESVREFEAALEGLGKEASIHVYEGAGHAFANPSGTRYQAEAAEDSWTKTLEFFARTLQ